MKRSEVLNETTEVINDTIPSYKRKKVLEIYNASLLKKTKLTLKDNKDTKKALMFSGELRSQRKIEQNT